MSASAPVSRDAADEGRDAAIVAAQLEDLLDDGAVLALEIACLAVDRHVVGTLLDVDEQPAVGHRVGGAGDPAVKAQEGDGAERRRAGEPGQRPPRRCRRLRTPVVPGNEQHPLLVADIDSERQRHAREDDAASIGTRRRRLVVGGMGASSLSIGTYE